MNLLGEPGVFPEIKLKIAGSGPEQIVLELLVDKLGLSSRIDFLGRVSHQNLVNLYQESTTAVFPFIQAEEGDMEGLGLVMVEALACQCGRAGPVQCRPVGRDRVVEQPQRAVQSRRG